MGFHRKSFRVLGKNSSLPSKLHQFILGGEYFIQRYAKWNKIHVTKVCYWEILIILSCIYGQKGRSRISHILSRTMRAGFLNLAPQYCKVLFDVSSYNDGYKLIQSNTKQFHRLYEDRGELVGGNEGYCTPQCRERRLRAISLKFMGQLWNVLAVLSFLLFKKLLLSFISRIKF